MTDQHTLKNIINAQREQIQKLLVELEFYKEANRELIEFKRQIMTEVHTPLAKIAEANKILDEKLSVNFDGFREDQIQRLRSVLK